MQNLAQRGQKSEAAWVRKGQDGVTAPGSHPLQNKSAPRTSSLPLDYYGCEFWPDVTLDLFFCFGPSHSVRSINPALFSDHLPQFFL